MANWWDDLEPAKPAAPSAAPWWADLEQNRETTGGEFVGGLMAQGARGIMRAGRDTLALAAKAGTAAPDAIRKLIGMEPIGPMLERQAGAFFEPGMQAATEMMPEAYQRELGREVIGQNEETGELEFSLPTGEQTVGTMVESLPQIPGMIAGGQGAAGLMARAFPKASQRPTPRTPAEAGSQAAEDALQQARARKPPATPAPVAAPSMRRWATFPPKAPPTLTPPSTRCWRPPRRRPPMDDLERLHQSLHRLLWEAAGLWTQQRLRLILLRARWETLPRRQGADRS
jgi:hypothetical protein